MSDHDIPTQLRILALEHATRTFRGGDEEDIAKAATRFEKFLTGGDRPASAPSKLAETFSKPSPFADPDPAAIHYFLATKRRYGARTEVQFYRIGALGLRVWTGALGIPQWRRAEVTDTVEGLRGYYDLVAEITKEQADRAIG
jgi:hypothetical protein